jgi:hypothetical protein
MDHDALAAVGIGAAFSAPPIPIDEPIDRPSRPPFKPSDPAAELIAALGVDRTAARQRLDLGRAAA